MSVLPFTGERFTPECEGRIAYEHVARYRVAMEHAHDKDVLDLASGEGYGSAMLASVAHSVIGVDIDNVSVNHARERYGKIPNLHFAQGSAARTRAARPRLRPRHLVRDTGAPGAARRDDGRSSAC